jgi:hypothetical protein
MAWLTIIVGLLAAIGKTHAGWENLAFLKFKKKMYYLVVCNGDSAQNVEYADNPIYFVSSKDGWKVFAPERVNAFKRMVYSVAENKMLLLTCPGSTKINFLGSTPAQRQNTLAVTCKGNVLKMEGHSIVSFKPLLKHPKNYI